MIAPSTTLGGLALALVARGATLGVTYAAGRYVASITGRDGYVAVATGTDLSAAIALALATFDGA